VNPDSRGALLPYAGIGRSAHPCECWCSCVLFFKLRKNAPDAAETASASVSVESR
jgi:hypothetical protein